MRALNRREFLTSAALSAATLQARAAGEKTRIGLVSSNNPELASPSSLEDPLDYEKVRDMVWKAIEHGRPRAGSLAAKIKPGDWVVLKPNIVFLRAQRGYCTGDVTDLRVTRAVLEYVARNSRASRITIAEGGSYRGVEDPHPDNVVRQNGQRVAAHNFDWGPAEFPGVGGTIEGMLHEFSARFPDKKFDYIDLSYDAVRDAAGNYRRIEVPLAPNGVGAFGARSDYYVTNTILNCDFLINMPVMKIHLDCGITACMKNYVGTAPREVYQAPGLFNNEKLHDQHTVEDRIDHFITDLVAFHPADYCIADCIRGLQYQEHNIRRPDQMVRSNMILAGEDIVAADAVISYLMGLNVWDIDHLHMGQRRQMGTMDLGKIDVIGDEADRLRRYWGRPRGWYGRGNREWRVTANPSTPIETWHRATSRTDTLHLDACLEAGVVPRGTYAAAVKVRSDGRRKAFLWVGVQGRVTAVLNGETVLEEMNRTRYRIGQFRQAVELRPGENLLILHAEALTDNVPLSAHLVGPRNDGDTVEGIRWLG